MTIDIKDCKPKIERFKYDKADLIETILTTIDKYRQINNIPESKAISLDTATITRYVAYETFDYIIGITRNSEWHKLYTKTEKVMRKVSSKRGLNWVILPKTKYKLEEKLHDELKTQEEKENNEEPTTLQREMTETKKIPIRIIASGEQEGKNEKQEKEIISPLKKEDDMLEDKKTIRTNANSTRIEDNTEENQEENQESAFIFKPKFKLKSNETQREKECGTLPELTKKTDQSNEINKSTKRGTNKSEINISLNIVVEDYFERVTAYKCKLCSFLAEDKETLVKHIKKHSIMDFC